MGKGTAPFGHSCPAQKGRLEREKGTVDRKGRESQLREKKGLSHHVPSSRLFVPPPSPFPRSLTSSFLSHSLPCLP